MKIGERIKTRRQELKFTQKDLAKALGLTPQHISVIEKDKRTPSLSSLARLADILRPCPKYNVRMSAKEAETFPA